jgi:hypothetical protein
MRKSRVFGYKPQHIVLFGIFLAISQTLYLVILPKNLVSQYVVLTAIEIPTKVIPK